MNATKATMNVCCFRTFGLIAGWAALVLPIQAYALSLGGFQVESALDEPLRAEIQLESVDAEELESLEVQLGSAEDFQRADVPRAEFLKQLQFEVTGTSDGGAFVTVTSEQPMKEPFLHFLIAAQWSGGKMVREYTGLLDPPLYAREEPAEIESPGIESSGVSAAEQPAPEPAAAPSESVTSVAPSASAGGRSAEYGPTREGDTLWDIAARLDTGAVQANVFQIMIALQRQNPDAFIDNNINRLKTGAILRLDDIAAVAEIPAQQASAAYTAQLEEWQATQQTQVAEATGAAGATDTAAADAGADTGASDAAETEAPAESAVADTGATPAEAGTADSGEDVLRIVQATVEETGEAENTSAGSDLAGEVAALRGQIATLEESLESRNLENEELRERVRLLEGQLENAQRLIEIESEELAAAQQQAAQAQAEAAEAQAQAEAAAAEAAQTQTQPEQAQADSSVAMDDGGNAAAGDSQQLASSSVQPVEESSPEVSASSPDAEQTTDNTAAGASEPSGQESQAGQAASEPPSQQAAPAGGNQAERETERVRTVSTGSSGTSWLAQIPDMLFSSWMWMLGAALGVLVLVLGLLMFLRRRQSIAEFEESILSGSALDGYSETTDTAATSSASDTSFLSDFGTAGMGTMQADEVDPLAEAEVYLAYGRDEQAEDVLKEAARRDPERSEVKLKLLEIYKQRNDVKAFETIAEELYPAGDSGDREVWAQVSEMGRELNPSNPLFQGAAPAPDSGGQAPEAVRPVEAAPTEETGGAPADSMDFNLDNLGPATETETAPPAPQPAAAASAGNELDFDLEPGIADEPDSPTAETVEPARDETTLDFADSFMEQPSANVDPATQPFPAPDQQTDLDAEFERLASEREASAARQAADSGGGEEETPAASQAPDWDKAESDAGTLDFPSSDNSDIDFELELDDNSIQQLAGGGAPANGEQQPAAQSAQAPDEPLGDTLLEFESENIPPEETWAGPSSDAAPTVSAEDEDSVTYTPADDVQSEGAPQYNEAETKLDLARAYLDMGDKVGARSIIDEVMREGDPAQRDQAAALAAQL
ncbi:MAG TPA: FimV/HubP family polar landmark protein [Arenicellales bacterium]|nr:FimV/HubP family polar landmark protein [Arenicellales bacterium]